MSVPRRVAVTAVTILTLLGLAPPASAVSSDAGNGPSFNESRGCGIGVAGTYRPHATRPGSLPSDFVVYGPYGDYFGRTGQQISGSLFTWVVPGSGGRTVQAHQRTRTALEAVAANIAATGNTYTVTSAASRVWRTVGGRTALSNHAFGTATDVNPPLNPFRRDNVLITNMPAWFVDAWTEAGFCWGGDWVDIKDPMHYSWMGPAATPGFGDRLAPYPPITAADAAGWAAVLDTVAPFADQGAGWLYEVADRSGDGAGDLYAVGPGPEGTLRVTAAGARDDFRTLGFRRDTAAPAAAMEMLLGDYDNSSRPDLWLIRAAGSTVEIDVYLDGDYFEAPEASFVAPIEPTGDLEFALAHYDTDHVLDLVVIRRGAPTRVEVWSGDSGFTTLVEASDTQIGDTSDAGRWTFAVGDYNVDGRPDVYGIDRGAPAVLHVASWRSGGAGRYDGSVAVIDTGIQTGPTARFLLGDYDGDGRDDFYVLNGRRLQVYLGGVRAAGSDLTFWFNPANAAPWDAGPECSGPEPCHSIGFAGSDAKWRLRDEVASESGYVEFLYGDPGDVPVVGDWDCDGTETPGLFRRSDGYAYLRNSNTTGIGDVSFFFGDPGDIPLAGDFDGDGCDTLSLYRPSEAKFFITNRLGTGDKGLGKAEIEYVFGNSGDKPFVGDFDGDGDDNVGLHRESTGFVYYRVTHTQGNADNEFFYGDPGDFLVAGDWNGDGTDTVAVFRPDDGRWYVKLHNRQGNADHVISFDGSVTIAPVAGHFGTSSRDG